MAHCSCLNGHNMWNGDGKPVVWVYRVGFLYEYSFRHPGQKLSFHSEPFQIYDCTYEYPDEDLDCWYCDKCHALTVFIDSLNIRYNFAEISEPLSMKEKDVADWDNYIALRDEEFEKFQDFYEGMTLIEAVEKYEFRYHYRVSPDKMVIYAFDRYGQFQFGYEQRGKYYLGNS